MDNLEINKQNNDGMSAIYQGISYAVQKGIKDAPYDKTFIGLVTATDLETNTYTVKINGYEYTDVISTIRTYPNHSVIVMCPQGQLSQMFIYGEIDTTNYSES